MATEISPTETLDTHIYVIHCTSQAVHLIGKQDVAAYTFDCLVAHAVDKLEIVGRVTFINLNLLTLTALFALSKNIGGSRR